MKYVFFILFAVTLGCAHGGHSSDVKKGQFAGVDYYYRSNTYFMKQPTPESLDQAKADGVSTVINLRTDAELKELKFDPKKSATDRGMTYYHFPVDSKKPLDKATLAKIESTFMSHHKNGEKVIVHCSSGQRAAAWFAYHVKTTHGSDSQQAIKEAGQIGLDRPDMVEKAKEVLD